MYTDLSSIQTDTNVIETMFRSIDLSGPNQARFKILENTGQGIFEKINLISMTNLNSNLFQTSSLFSLKGNNEIVFKLSEETPYDIKVYYVYLKNHIVYEKQISELTQKCQSTFLDIHQNFEQRVALNQLWIEKNMAIQRDIRLLGSQDSVSEEPVSQSSKKRKVKQDDQELQSPYYMKGLQIAKDKMESASFSTHEFAMVFESQKQDGKSDLYADCFAMTQVVHKQKPNISKEYSKLYESLKLRGFTDDYSRVYSDLKVFYSRSEYVADKFATIYDSQKKDGKSHFYSASFSMAKIFYCESDFISNEFAKFYELNKLKGYNDHYCEAFAMSKVCLNLTDEISDEVAKAYEIRKLSKKTNTYSFGYAISLIYHNQYFDNAHEFAKIYESQKNIKKSNLYSLGFAISKYYFDELDENANKFARVYETQMLLGRTDQYSIGFATSQVVDGKTDDMTADAFAKVYELKKLSGDLSFKACLDFAKSEVYDASAITTHDLINTELVFVN